MQCVGNAIAVQCGVGYAVLVGNAVCGECCVHCGNAAVLVGNAVGCVGIAVLGNAVRCCVGNAVLAVCK